MADIRKSYQWLEKAGLTDSTEALILAAQEQALGTRSIEAGVYHTRQDPRCRLCKEASETVQHIVAGCKMQAETAYTERHNQVAVIVYRNICSEYGLDPPKSRGITKQQGKAPVGMANQPDIVVIDKQKEAVVIDVAVPSDNNIKKKYYEKLVKYQGLKEELEKMWKVNVKMAPVVIGALGAVTPTLEEWPQQIPGTTSELSVQKSAVLGTAKILKPQAPKLLVEDPRLRKTHLPPTEVRREFYIYRVFCPILKDSCSQPCSLPQVLQASGNSLSTPGSGVHEKQHCRRENCCCKGG